jgi:hypothetical protein
LFVDWDNTQKEALNMSQVIKFKITTNNEDLTTEIHINVVDLLHANLQDLAQRQIDTLIRNGWGSDLTVNEIIFLWQGYQ